MLDLFDVLIFYCIKCSNAVYVSFQITTEFVMRSVGSKADDDRYS
jgi:hypothetical protein